MMYKLSSGAKREGEERRLARPSWGAATQNYRLLSSHTPPYSLPLTFSLLDTPPPISRRRAATDVQPLEMELRDAKDEKVSASAL